MPAGAPSSENQHLGGGAETSTHTGHLNLGQHTRRETRPDGARHVWAWTLSNPSGKRRARLSRTQRGRGMCGGAREWGMAPGLARSPGRSTVANDFDAPPSRTHTTGALGSCRLAIRHAASGLSRVRRSGALFARCLPVAKGDGKVCVLGRGFSHRSPCARICQSDRLLTGSWPPISGSRATD
jgi:hypothetical protein